MLPSMTKIPQLLVRCLLLLILAPHAEARELLARFGQGLPLS